MTNPVFPADPKQDSKYYEVELEDPTLRTNMEGGYVVTRPKHTRKPRRTFKSGCTSITSDQRKALEDFYDSVRGGSVIFDWTDPVTGTVFQVRFKEKISFKYTGMGITQLWDVTFTLEQA